VNTESTQLIVTAYDSNDAASPAAFEGDTLIGAILCRLEALVRRLLLPTNVACEHRHWNYSHDALQVMYPSNLSNQRLSIITWQRFPMQQCTGMHT
jgi:hypothetical protein